MNLIGLSGLKQSGKDTAYYCIKELLPEQRVSRVALGDKVKELAGRGIGYDGPAWSSQSITDEINNIKLVASFGLFGPDSTKAVATFTMRDYLQDLGHGCRVMFGEDFWIDQVLPKLEPEETQERFPDVDTLVVTDVRYPNEAQRVLWHGGSIVEIVRPGLESDGKPSETPLPRDLITARVVNDAGKRELTEACRKALALCA